jgi:hypothetical protein
MSYTKTEKLYWELYGLQQAIDKQRGLADAFASLGRTHQAIYALLELELAKDDLQKWKKKYGLDTRR